MQYRLRTLLSTAKHVPEPESSGDEEDDGLQIGVPVAMLLNLTGAILIVAVIVKWVGCR
jgi:hypothetical protein